MKTKIIKTKLSLGIAFLFSASLAMGSSLEKEQPAEDTLNYISYSGTVLDARTNDELAFAAVEAEGSNVATVTNIDGDFVLKLDKKSEVDALKISYIGYKNKIVPL